MIPKLHSRQLLDEDKTLGVALWVQDADDHGVTIMEGNSLYHTTFVYDREGMIWSQEVAISSFPSASTFRSRRVGAE